MSAASEMNDDLPVAGGGSGEIMLFGVRLVADSMRKSVGLNNLSQYVLPQDLNSSTNGSSGSAAGAGAADKEDSAAAAAASASGYASSDDVVHNSSSSGRERKRGGIAPKLSKF